MAGLNTTDTESFGVAVLEAAFSGIPTVSTNVGELPYIWKNEEDIKLISSFDEKDFSKAVIHYFEDTPFYSKVKKNALRKAQNFIWKNVRDRWIEILN